jgi:TPR repeat protein
LVVLGGTAEPGCEAVGFPDQVVQRPAGSEPALVVRQTEQIRGDLLPMGQAKRPVHTERELPKAWMPLDVSITVPSSPEGWGGISGAGVVLPDGRLAAMVVAVDREHQLRRLYAVPLAEALQHAGGFAAALAQITTARVVAEARLAPEYRRRLTDRSLGQDGLPLRLTEVADLDAFGVKRVDLSGDPPHLAYVPRDGDEMLRNALAEAADMQRMLLLVGNSGAGKTRSAVEAAKRSLPTNRFLRPREDLFTEVPDLPLRDVQPAVVWLDDVEKYAHPALGETLRRLLQAGATVIATIRLEELKALPATGERRNPTGEALADGSIVCRLDWPRNWSRAELERVPQHVANPALRLAAASGIALGVWAVAGPQLLLRLDNSDPDDYPCRGLLLRAVLDWYRTGLTTPIPLGTAFDLVNRAYLDDPADPAELEEALGWATEPVSVGGRRSRHSLLTLQAGDLLTVNDYIQDHDRRSVVPPVPEPVWPVALAAASDDDARSAVGWNALQAFQMTTARSAFEPLAHAGQAEAMGLLGVLLKAEDPDAARQWFQRAAETGDVYAMLNLGTELRDEDPAAARQWWQRAADAGNTSAMNNLGWLLKEQGDPDAARSWFQRAADAGDATAMNNLGLLLLEDEDPAAARRWFQRAADAGDATAMNNLGLLLAEEDPAAAQRWFQQAADADDAEAMSNLAVLLAEDDPAAARRWFQRAADAGNARAMFSLGVLLQDEDPAAAWQWWQRAADGGHTDAMNNVGIHLREQGDLEAARAWLQRAADAGNVTAMNSIGLVLEEEGDAEAARGWLQRAADAGNAEGMYNLGLRLYEAEDRAGAQHWWQRAADAGSAEAMTGLGALLKEQDPPAARE